MIIKSIKTKKTLAFFFLSLLTLENLMPHHALALTSGPTQPEHKQFAPYSTNDMVDLFSGGFKYNIPLLDVDGYPININYASGAGMDDEASWVGLGWNLNVGAVNRQLRGVPDDFSGDVINTQHTVANRYVYGGTGKVRLELKGLDVAKVSGEISVGVFSDSYNGMGAEFGANAGLSLGLDNSGYLTAGLNAGFTSNTSSGVTVSGGATFGTNSAVSTGVSANLSYNTREGLKELTLSQSFGMEKFQFESGRSYIYNTPPFSPKIRFGNKLSSQSYSITIGGTGFTVFGGAGLTGYMSKQSVLDTKHTNPEYGYLYANRGTNVKDAVMDFMREKDNPVIPNLPNVAVPISTPDVFSYTNQAGSGQFRLQRGNSAVVFDPNAEDKSDNFTLGADYGFGAYFHGGVTLYNQDVNNVTRKWKTNNNFLPFADYKEDGTKVDEEQAYFKMMGEQTAEDAAYVNKIQGEKVVSVSLMERSALAQLQDDKGNSYSSVGGYKKTGRQKRVSPVSYLTASEAMSIPSKGVYSSYKFYDSTLKTPPTCGPEVAQSFSRVLNKPGHHLSEITVTESDGKRAVYGLPVYNIHQDEYTFAVNPAYKNIAGDKENNLIKMDLDANGEIKHEYGKDQFYQHETQPGYASSFLLTAILSPDYVDLTNNGITDDDLGTAIKFNYSKVAANFAWRSPMQEGKALFNRGLNADSDDDKGNVVYGEKELWYLNSIETKTKIAYFITADRDDALGVTDINGKINTGVKQKRLKEIRLYSKSDLSTPIKTTFFEYDYSLCPGIPNSINGGGKLTLKKIYSTYGSSKKGAHHPYVFEYANNQAYALMSTDRWGSFKPITDNAAGGFGGMKNDEFPYTIQNAALANSNAAKWNLTTVKLPTGGEINVDYEAGDYAYVQDRKAMQMVDIKDMVTDSIGTTTNNLRAAHGIKITAPGPLRGKDDGEILRNFVTDYLNGRNDFYVKMNVNVTDDVSNKSDDTYDNISCYGEVVKVRNNKDGTYNIMFKDVSEGGVAANPFIMAAWQKMRLEYPKYAYPGYEDRIQNETGIERALTAIVNAIGNLSELRKNFNERAKDNDFAVNFNKGKSFARIVKGDGIKIGGPARVRKIRMTDNWNVMSNNTAPTAVYGQQYEYRIASGDQMISSGVASYEPSIGADENPMRMPVPYSQESRGTLTNYFYLEEPFGESLFPAPQVGYSNVIVRDLDASGNADPAKNTGWLQYEFYTAKDYPVIVAAQAKPDVRQEGPSGWANFSGGNQVYELALSQGYVIWLNDMHGKPKGERVFNKSGGEISSSLYYYKSDLLDAGKRKLNNAVTTVDEKGNINPAEILGREIEMVTDMREQESKNMGTTVQLGVDVIPFIFGSALPIPHWPRKQNDNYRLFRSAAVLKTIQQTGIIDKVVKTINGSTVTSSTMVFDRNTGQAIVTKTNNEYNDPVYSVSMPAYWEYGQMSGAYKNVNTVLNNFKTDNNGLVDAAYAGLLTGGDEITDLKTADRYWVVNSPTANDPVNRIRLTDDGGNLVKGLNSRVKISRSGFRNQLGATISTVVCMNNPLSGNKLGIFSSADATAYKVLDAKTTLYEEEWGSKICYTCPSGYVLSADGTRCDLLPAISTNDTLNIVKGTRYSEYSQYGTNFILSDNSQVGLVSDFWGGNCSSGNTSLMRSLVVGPTLCGPLNRSGVRLNKADTAIFNTWMGFETCFNVPATRTYSIGYGVDNFARIYIDDVPVVEMPDGPPYDPRYQYWTVVAKPLTAGKHRLRVEFFNKAFPNQVATTNYASVGVEVYPYTPDELYAMNQNTINESVILFSTNSLPYSNAPTNVYILDGNNRRASRYACTAGSMPGICDSPFVCDSRSALIVNPYLAGVLGNWRVSEEKIHETVRNDQRQFSNPGIGLDLRNSGSYKSFKPYWLLNTTGVSKTTDATALTQWVTSRYVTLYDKYGQEQENKDALLRYSSAAFAYRGAVPVAVAANARRREIYFDGFEDYKFNGLCGAFSCSSDSFDIHSLLGSNYQSSIVSDDAHTGNYALKLTRAIDLSTSVHSLEQAPGDGNYLSKDAFGQYIRKLTKGIYPAGFEPVPSKTYMFSAWVKDGSNGNSLPAINVLVNNSNVTLTRKATVEGWKLVEGTITVPANATTFQLKIPAAPSIIIDDIRIFPVAGNIKTYAYDEKTLRLMAEMDENNFATFYEYDDEGTLIRVKKETDRGIMTLKENRSVYRKIN